MAQFDPLTSLQKGTEPIANAQATATDQWPWICCDRYELKRPLGGSSSQRRLSLREPSSMVRTFLAWDHREQSDVVLKALAFEQIQDWKTFERFEREARALSQLNHPAIPRYLDYVEQRQAAGSTAPEAGSIDGTGASSTFYLVQAYVEGLSLGERVRRGDRFSEDAVKAIARQGLEILTYLHSLNPPLIHRDIKPDNLICPYLAPQPQIYLVDFGAAQAVNSSGSTVVGTYGYMAPEQFQGQASTASDLYSFGATLLNLLTHQDPIALPTHRLRIDFRAVLNLSDDFAQWLDGLLAPVAADRFGSARQALAALDDPNLTAQVLPPHQTLPQQLKLSGANAIAPATRSIQLDYDSGSYPLHQARLSLAIAPVGLQRELWALGAFALLWNGGLLYWLIMAWVMKAPWFYPLASAPFWGIGGFLIARLGQALFGQARLTVDQGQYCLEQRVGPFQRQWRGPLGDWWRVDLRQQYRRGNEAITTLLLDLGQETVELGTMLSETEKAWLVSELQTFLSEQVSAGR